MAVVLIEIEMELPGSPMKMMSDMLKTPKRL